MYELGTKHTTCTTMTFLRGDCGAGDPPCGCHGAVDVLTDPHVFRHITSFQSEVAHLVILFYQQNRRYPRMLQPSGAFQLAIERKNGAVLEAFYRTQQLGY